MPALTISNTFVADREYSDGINRITFEQAIDHVVTRRFNWDHSVADVIKNEYTNWKNIHDPIVNRDQYVHVSF